MTTPRKAIAYKRLYKVTTSVLLLLTLSASAQYSEVPPLEDALAKLQKGHYSPAIPQFAKALQKDPDNYAANLGMGISLRETDKPDSALLYLDHAIKIQPTAEAYLNRAALLYTLKQVSKGDKDGQTAMHMQPHSASMYELWGYCLLKRKDYARAITVLDSAIAKDKNTYKAYVNKASALNNLNKHQEAIVVLSRVNFMPRQQMNSRP